MNEHSGPPPLIYTLAEPLRTSMELGALLMSAPFLWTAPRGAGQRVLVLPGFSFDDSSTLLLRAYLSWLGYSAAPLGVGQNFGRRTFGDDYLRLDELVSGLRDDDMITLIGHSLGGVMAREYARRNPEHVERVISLGSPYVGDEASMPRGIVWLRRRLTDEDTSVAPDLSPLPVPHTVIYSRTDGVVSPFDCRASHAGADNVEVVGSHMGLVVNCMAFRVIADRLAGEGPDLAGAIAA